MHLKLENKTMQHPSIMDYSSSLQLHRRLYHNPKCKHLVVFYINHFLSIPRVALYMYGDYLNDFILFFKAWRFVGNSNIINWKLI